MENPYVKKYFEMMSLELEKMARGMILWNNFSYELIFPNLSDNNLQKNIYDTYKNILESTEDLGEDGHKIGEKIGDYLCKIIERWNLEEDRDYLVERVRYRREDKINMYIIFKYLYRSLELMRGNYMIMFMENIVYMDFKNNIEDERLLDSLLFIQNLIKILKGVIDVHKKRKRIILEGINLRKNIKNRRYF